MSDSEVSAADESLVRALDSAIDGMALLDDDGRYTYVNQAHVELYGFDDPEELIGKEWRRFYDDAERERFEQDILPTVRQQGSWRGTATGQRRDGGQVPQELSLTALSDGRIICVVRDITERREHRETLEQYETVLTHVRDGVYTLDTDGRITWVNQTAIEEFDVGYTRDELVGEPVSKVLGPEDIDKCLTIIQNLISNDQQGSGRCEVALQTAFDTEIPCDLNLTLLRDEAGSVQGTVGVLREITERKQREQRLSVLQRVLRHNLRNELNVVMGQADLIARTVDDHDITEKAETIQETAERLRSLGEKARAIETMLQRDASHRQSVDVTAIIEASCESFREDYPDAAIRTDLPDKQTVFADETLEAVVDNLVENALEHTGPEPTVDVSVTTAEPASERVHLQVADDGPGIPVEETEILHESEETQLSHGTGLGLWLVYWLVDSFGGDVSFPTTEQGGTVRVTLRAPQGTE